MRLLATEHAADDTVTTLELRFPGGVNIAQRVMDTIDR
jgi:hypothetical protein